MKTGDVVEVLFIMIFVITIIYCGVWKIVLPLFLVIYTVYLISEERAKKRYVCEQKHKQFKDHLHGLSVTVRQKDEVPLSAPRVEADKQGQVSAIH